MSNVITKAIRRTRTAGDSEPSETPAQARARLLTGGSREGHLPRSPKRAAKINMAPKIEEPTDDAPLMMRVMSSLSASSSTIKDLVAQRKARSTRITGDGTSVRSQDRARQVLAWDLYDEIGELREATALVADAVASADLFVGQVIPGQQEPQRIPEDDPNVSDDEIDTDLSEATRGLMPDEARAVQDLLLSMVQSGAMARMAKQLFVTAETFLLGTPLDIEAAKPGGPAPPATERIGPDENMAPVLDGNLQWHALSFDEVKIGSDQHGETDDSETITVMIDGEWHVLQADRVVGISIWMEHPRRSDRLDSGVLSALPILLQLVAVAQYAGATLDSRLSGPGIFVIPQSALSLPDGVDPNDRNAIRKALGEFMKDLTEAMVTPIEDRSSPSAVVPITIAVPDEATGKFDRITFDVPLSGDIAEREEHLIKRLARSLDLPPEQLLGVGDMNHWSAWQVDESTVKAHVEPMLRAIVRELTVAILWPTLEEAGTAAEDSRKWGVGFDTSALQLRPNRMLEAQSLHDRHAISDKALRRVGGFTEDDAPQTTDAWAAATETAVELVARAPTLAANPGIQALAMALYTLSEQPPETADEANEILEAIPEVAPAGDEPTEEPETTDTSVTPDTGPGATEQEAA